MLVEAAEFRRYHSTRGGEPCNCCVQLSIEHAVEMAACGHITFPRAGGVEDSKAMLDLLLDRGWEYKPCQDGLLLRCSECRKPARPWIASLDVERIQSWLQAQFDKHGDYAWFIDFDDLRRACL